MRTCRSKALFEVALDFEPCSMAVGGIDSLMAFAARRVLRTSIVQFKTANVCCALRGFLRSCNGHMARATQQDAEKSGLEVCGPRAAHLAIAINLDVQLGSVFIHGVPGLIERECIPFLAVERLRRTRLQFD